jgi:hypothetical protein
LFYELSKYVLLLHTHQNAQNGHAKMPDMQHIGYKITAFLWGGPSFEV